MAECVLTAVGREGEGTKWEQKLIITKEIKKNMMLALNREARAQGLISEKIFQRASRELERI